MPPQPPAPQQESFTAIESPSLQFLPRRDEAAGWRLDQDPIVIPANRLNTYLGPLDYNHFAHYEVIDATIGNYTSTTSDGFAMVEIYRFPDFVKAFGAYSTRKSDNVQYLPVSNEAYTTAHFINVWRGPFYVRIIGGGTDAAGLLRLANFVADRMPVAPAKPAVFNFFPNDTRVPNSEKYNSENGFGEATLANSFQTRFNVAGDNIDALIIPAANRDAAARILNAYRNLYIRNGKLLDPIPNLGEDNFSGEDKYLGRAVAFRIDRFLIAFNGYCDRQKLVDLAAATDQKILGSIRKQLVTADKNSQ
ncbi:MAG TPA: DUF6599 family protein [Thermoanaerobaculia bacterium]|nr:DUF6599 family protein [Thermoanaerobaculia bacterium]